ncbi:uncharacterized protein L969DRAFT_92909 [Mixia osmundae IAM 14324]|uniref:Uncharacterized protein n=1 Tax=Mixia osmundae (strain CBS 9802 / IAM 14324 / JCM 22182 / KY 12970) TaxID=764103 RepID=G7DTQ8_MIXOS|nr:uncharacterized protein L969DRAFT_92909 [Mixia osmundae IAM 14324]KEI41683.1 hypothetical protein L969DRAFT_92909 [Mixia osmundae IAM 14324]GAA93968.1 hypothetical protein E5Q_00614 [Mixia osmundae IAM 14324]
MSTLLFLFPSRPYVANFASVLCVRESLARTGLGDGREHGPSDRLSVVVAPTSMSAVKAPTSLSTSLPDVPVGQDPFDYYIAISEELIHPTPTGGYEARLWALTALASVHILLTTVHMSMTMRSSKLYICKRVKRPEGYYIIVNPMLAPACEIAAGAVIIASGETYRRVYVQQIGSCSELALHALTWVPLWVAYVVHVVVNSQALALMTTKSIISPHWLNWVAYGLPACILIPLITLGNVADHRLDGITASFVQIKSELQAGQSLYAGSSQAAKMVLTRVYADYDTVILRSRHLVGMIRGIYALWVLKLFIGLAANYSSLLLLKHITETLRYHREQIIRSTTTDKGDVDAEKDIALTVTLSYGTAERSRDTNYRAHVVRLAELKLVMAVVIVIGTITCISGMAIALLGSIVPFDALLDFPTNEVVGCLISWVYLLLIIPARGVQICRYIWRRNNKVMTLHEALSAHEDPTTSSASVWTGIHTSGAGSANSSKPKYTQPDAFTSDQIEVHTTVSQTSDG